MLALLEYFGDVDDLETPCRVCDVCAIDGCALAQHRAPTARETQVIEHIVAALSEQDGQAVGRLYNAGLWEGELDRREFEKLLGALVRSGYVKLSVETFEKAGKSIEYRRASLTPGIHGLEGTVAENVRIPVDRPKPPSKRKKRPPKGTKKTPGAKAKTPTKATPRAKPLLPDALPPDDDVHPALLAALKAWRLEEARRRSVPAFQIFTDRSMKAIASDRPRNEEELLNVHGIGPRSVKKYGSTILKIVASVV
jgi:DNA topoisomerase-3